jgi:general nucleoside transport system ATP-binding protein
VATVAADVGGERPGPDVPLAVHAVGIVKRFPGVVANDGVNVDVARGQVHTLLGENGAGKSTLAAVLSGLYQPDAGQLYRNGQVVRLSSPRAGLRHGIAMVHQHFRLVERFTVAENVVLGSRDLPFRLRRGAIDDEVAAVGERFGLPVDPKARIADLAVGQRQRVEIVKALYQGAEVLLLDEPTAVLTPPEVDRLFETVRAMTKDGRSVVFISHKLGEVMEISDRITVMRDGRVTGVVDAADVDARILARMMVGRDVDLSARHASAPPLATVLRVTGLRCVQDGRAHVDGVSLEVRGGEIVGVAGVAGNGQRQMAGAIAGMDAPAAGSVEIGDQDITGRGPRAARAAGLAFVPEDRQRTGLAPSLTIAENLLLTQPRSTLIDRGKAAADAATLIETFEVKARGPSTPIRKLSGGNAQKVLVARELLGHGGERPRVLIASSPTHGLDVGATQQVRELLHQFRSEGAAVLLISEDLDEVLSLADRVLVLYRGRIVHTADAGHFDVERIGLAMAGVDVEEVAP